MKKYFCNLLFFSLIISFSCTSQVKDEYKSSQSDLKNLKPAFAGQFYPADKDELYHMLADLYANAKARNAENVIALIAPHAGYVFSGSVAASVYNQIDPDKTYENIFIIASSHMMYFNGASIYSAGNFETPLGEIKINVELAEKLINLKQGFSFVPEAFTGEHSLEVQLPFLQFHMKKDLQIIPIIIGTQSAEVCKQLADALKPYFNEQNLFIISSDFSHYPEYAEANKWDKKTAQAIIINSPTDFLNAINDPMDDKVINLVTRACGWSSILTLLYLTENNQNIEYTLIDSRNSGESSYGDKEKVVGYNAIIACNKSENQIIDAFNLCDDDKKELLNIAKKTIYEYISSNRIPTFNTEAYSKTLKTNCGAFVTLHKKNELRGCIGRFDAEQPLYEVVMQMSIASAMQDSRFLPVSKNELKDLEIEISVLSPMKKINSIDEIILGKHGIYIVKGNHNGTFLPQVATETGWDLEEFLGHCSRDKAGLSWDGWKEAEIFIYEAIVFSEYEIR
jgi:MEMO1 family protein